MASGERLPALLNVGCGRNFHPDWRNVDLVSTHPSVLAHDLRDGIPFEDGAFDAVYHSHVLEHLKPEDGVRLLKECFRVLCPGGVLRVVVPDLEGIARTYLRMLDAAAAGVPGAHHDHYWMQLEMFDQMVRSQSGGKMGPYLASDQAVNRSFLESRMGAECANCAADQVEGRESSAPWLRIAGRLRRRLRRQAEKGRRAILKLLFGRSTLELIDEARFRGSGEIHRWMYDRVSLASLLSECGFQQPCVVSADDSRIDGFARFQLDSVGSQIRKPDSLFMEAVKPGKARAKAA